MTDYENQVKQYRALCKAISDLSTKLDDLKNYSRGLDEIKEYQVKDQKIFNWAIIISILGICWFIS